MRWFGFDIKVCPVTGPRWHAPLRVEGRTTLVPRPGLYTVEYQWYCYIRTVLLSYRKTSKVILKSKYVCQKHKIVGMPLFWCTICPTNKPKTYLIPTKHRVRYIDIRQPWKRTPHLGLSFMKHKIKTTCMHHNCYKPSPNVHETLHSWKRISGSLVLSAFFEYVAVASGEMR